jgi:transposase
MEKEHVLTLLQGLCDGIVQPPQEKGRRRLLLSDVVYGSVLKVYTTMSGRRASSDIRDCQEKGFIDHAPCYNSVFNYLQKPELTPLFKMLIEESALPLKAVESNFAVDSTAFGTCNYLRWFDQKYGKPMKLQKWVKAHAMIGTRTNVVTSIEITDGDAGDSPQLAGLVGSTAHRFDVKEVSADKAYLAHANLDAIANVGAVPYIPFKSNSQGQGPEQWQKLWHLFWFRRREFEQHYHLRSNVETSFSMIKRKFGGSIRSKLYPAQVNEILAKVLCHNLAVLVHEMYELGIEPEFWGHPVMARVH